MTMQQGYLNYIEKHEESGGRGGSIAIETCHRGLILTPKPIVVTSGSVSYTHLTLPTKVNV